MRIDVHNVEGAEVGLFQRVAHCPSSTQSFGIWLSNVVTVRGETGTSDVGVNPGTACTSELFGFEDECPCSFAHDKAITINVVWT